MCTLFNWTNFCFLSIKEMCFLFYLSFFFKKREICVWSSEMEISRIAFDSRRVVPLRTESSDRVGLWSATRGRVQSVKYIFKKNFFATYDASDRRSYTLLSYFARAAFNYPALYATVLYGEVLASFTNYVFVFFHDFELFDQLPPFPLRRTKHRYIPLYAL